MAKKKSKAVKTDILKMVHISAANISLLVKAVADTRVLNQTEKLKLFSLLEKLNH